MARNAEASSYKLREGSAYVPIASSVQEVRLAWESGADNGEYIISNMSHLALMNHKYSNVV